MQTREVFKALKFEEVWGEMTDQDPSYRYNHGNLELTAVQVTNKYIQPIFLLRGVANDGRNMMMIDCEIPLQVESFEQGVAYIAFALHDFQPQKPILWLNQGRQWAELLPWERNRRKYAERPKCFVDWEWFRVAANKLREQAKSADPNDFAIIEFDGEVLRIKTRVELIAMPAQGTSWDQPCFIPVSKLNFLPKRITKQPVCLSIWDGKLTVGNRAFQLSSGPSLKRDV
jgi:hypothetical protein